MMQVVMGFPACLRKRKATRNTKHLLVPQNTGPCATSRYIDLEQSLEQGI